MNDMAIITSFFNPLNFKSRKSNLIRFMEFLKESGVDEHFYICEILFDGQEPSVKHKNVLHLKSNSILWHKEKSLNILEKIIPETYTKIIWVDADIMWFNKNWYSDISKLLEDYNMIHPMKCCRFLDYRKQHIYSKNSYVAEKILNGGEIPITTKRGDLCYGFAMAFKREFFHKFGLFDRGLIGHGDFYNIISIEENWLDTLSKLLSKDNSITAIKVDSIFKNYIINYVDMCNKWINNKYSFYDDEIVHLYHGELTNRKYNTRSKIFSDLYFDDIFVQGSNGLYEFKESVSEYATEFFKTYFLNRKDDTICNVDSDAYLPEISSDGSNFMWMSDKNKFTIRNIKKIKIHLSRNCNNHTTDYINLLHNGQVFKITFDSYGKAIIELSFNESTEEFSTFSNFFVPSKIDSNSNDTRKLSCIIEKVFVIYDGKNTFDNYELYDIAYRPIQYK